MSPMDIGRRLIAQAQHIVVFTGAGMSAESGVPTFRDAGTGLWAQFDVSQLATPQAWAHDSELVWRWYAERAAGVRATEPNAGHHAIAALARDRRAAGGSVRVVTQNVDDLHERAGLDEVCHLHGSLFAPRCDHCSRPAALEAALRAELSACPACPGRVRPGVVWFGEALPIHAWDYAEAAFDTADLVVVVGTSGVVHPAASLPETAALRGVPVIEVNPEASELTRVNLRIKTTAAEGLPLLFA